MYNIVQLPYSDIIFITTTTAFKCVADHFNFMYNIVQSEIMMTSKWYYFSGSFMPSSDPSPLLLSATTPCPMSLQCNQMVSFCHFNFIEQHCTLIHQTHIQLVLLLMFFYNFFLLLCLIEIRLSIICTLYNIRFIFCKKVFNTFINLVRSKHEIKQHHETEIHQTS